MTRYLILLSLITISLIGESQTPIKRYRLSYDSITCYASDEHARTFVRPQENRRTPHSRTENATFVIDYFGFTDEAKEAFDYAIDIWSNYISSPVPIHIEANWESLGDGTLGSAIWGTLEEEVPGGLPGTNYPAALAEKIAGRELNGDAPDIITRYNLNRTDWYFGTDGNTPDGMYDLVSVAMHEIGHGLGISDSFRDDERQQLGSFGRDGVPIIYDRYVGNAAGEILVDEFTNSSFQLHNQLIGDDLFYISPIAYSMSNDQYPKLNAPNPFSSGSSIAHLDESTYPAGDPNSLMSPNLSRSEAIHDPGPMILGMLGQIGWLHTYFYHDPVPNTELLNDHVEINTSIVSDAQIDMASATLYYSIDEFQNDNQVATLSYQGSEVYSYSIDAFNSEVVVSYFFTVEDEYGREYREPLEGYHNFIVGIDTEEPTIEHEAITYVFADETELLFEAQVEDNFDLDNVTLSYNKQGEPIQEIEMNKAEGNLYVATVDLIPLNIADNDVIEYFISAVDNSVASNNTLEPASGQHSISVVEYRTVVDQYVNNFDQPSNDFAGPGFRVETPDGFTTPAIHSDHPYQKDKDYFYDLLYPIKISSPFYVKFDEVVLVQPGLTNSQFGATAFYDYVIVEGSKDGGENWDRLDVGYDAREQNTWFEAYNDDFDEDTSLAMGNESMYRKRTIDVLDNGKFAVDDEVIFRFRLYSDEDNNGWGWSIDNLVINDEIVSLDKAQTSISIYPNPANSFVRLDIPPNMRYQVGIYDLKGTLIHSSANPKIIDLKSFPKGPYILKILADDFVRTEKLLVR